MSWAASDLTAAPFYAAAGLLLASGWAKLRRPHGTSTALARAGLPDRLALVRLLGTLEILVGALAVAVPKPAVALGVATLYLSFAAYLAVLLARGESGSCGCVGSRDVPPSGLHVLLDLFAAATGVAAAVHPVGGTVAFLRAQPLSGMPFLVGTVALAGLCYLTVAYLPAMFFAYRADGSPDRTTSEPSRFHLVGARQ